MCGSLPFQRVVWGAAWVQGHKKRRDIDSSFLVAPPRLEREFRLGNLVFIYSTSHIFSKLRIEPKNIWQQSDNFCKNAGSPKQHPHNARCRKTTSVQRYKLFSTDKTEYEKTSHDDGCADCNDAEPTQVLRCRILFDLFRACVFLFVRRGLFVGGFA